MEDKDFEPNGIFGSRGIFDPKVAEGAFHRFEQNQEVDVIDVFNDTPGRISVEDPWTIVKYAARCSRLARRASGWMMRRFAVPEADQFILNEQRPDWPIWVGDVEHPEWMGGIKEPHVHAKAFPFKDDTALKGRLGGPGLTSHA